MIVYLITGIQAEADYRYCAKFVGKKGTKLVVIRECAVKSNPMTEFSCVKDTEFIPTTTAFKDTYSKGTVCHCKGDHCNGSTMVRTATALIPILALILYQAIF